MTLWTRLTLWATLLAMVLAVTTPAMGQDELGNVDQSQSQEPEQEAESGDFETGADVANSGDMAALCTPINQGGNTGNNLLEFPLNQGDQAASTFPITADVVIVDESELSQSVDGGVDEASVEDTANNITVEPQLESGCVQTIEVAPQAAGAS